MRALVIVNPGKVIEALLLLQEVEGGRLGRLLLQGQVQACVTTVLLRVTVIVWGQIYFLR